MQVMGPSLCVSMNGLVWDGGQPSPLSLGVLYLRFEPRFPETLPYKGTYFASLSVAASGHAPVASHVHGCRKRPQLDVTIFMLIFISPRLDRGPTM